MSSNSEEMHIDLRASTGTARDWCSDWHAQFTKDGIAARDWNGRMLAWINAELVASYTGLNEAMRAYAVAKGFNRFSDINNLTGL